MARKKLPEVPLNDDETYIGGKRFKACPACHAWIGIGLRGNDINMQQHVNSRICQKNKAAARPVIGPPIPTQPGVDHAAPRRRKRAPRKTKKDKHVELPASASTDKEEDDDSTAAPAASPPLPTPVTHDTDGLEQQINDHIAQQSQPAADPDPMLDAPHVDLHDHHDLATHAEMEAGLVQFSPSPATSAIDPALLEHYESLVQAEESDRRESDRLGDAPVVNVHDLLGRPPDGLDQTMMHAHRPPKRSRSPEEAHLREQTESKRHRM